MLEVVFGALALFGAASYLSSRGGQGGDSFGAHLDGAPGFKFTGKDGRWETYSFSGPSGSFTVAMYPSAAGSYPKPSGSNVEFEYEDGVSARSVRATGKSGRKWDDVDLPGVRKYDLYVYHPQNHPGEFLEEETQANFGAVSWWQGGRGPRAGVGTSSVGGGRQVAVPYAFSSSTESGYRNFHEENSLDDPQAEWVEEFGAWRDPETGQCWNEERQEWTAPEEMGFTILGLTIPTTKEERMERLDGKIEKAEARIKTLEAAAKAEGADLDKIARQIASQQQSIDKWEEKRGRIEDKMAGMEDFGEDDLFGDDDLESEDFGEEDDFFGEEDFGDDEDFEGELDDLDDL